MTYQRNPFTDNARAQAWVSLNQKLGFDPVNSPIDPSHLYDVLTPLELVVLQDSVNKPIRYYLTQLAQSQYRPGNIDQ